MAQDLTPSHEVDLRTSLVVALCIPWLWSCANGRAEVAPPVQKLRISAGVPTGTFGPFSDSFVRGYAGLMPDLHFELIDAPGSVRNLEALAKME